MEINSFSGITRLLQETNNSKKKRRSFTPRPPLHKRGGEVDRSLNVKKTKNFFLHILSKTLNLEPIYAINVSLMD